MGTVRRIGLDPGQRRTGLAICDEGTSVAVPIGTVEHVGLKQALVRVREAIVARSVDEVVVGLPLRLDGSEGQAAKRVRRFMDALCTDLDVPIVFWDERLSTVAAERALSDQGVDGRARRRVIDQAAATIMLQSYIDAKVETCQVDPTDVSIPPTRKPGAGRSRTRSHRPRGRRGER